jgi:hypothetical protein
MGNALKPGRKKRVKGRCPLQGQGTASLVGFGETPQLLGVDHSKGKVKHGTLVAGSEASLRSN